MTTDSLLEQEIQAKGLTAARVTLGDIEAEIVREYYFSAGDGVAANVNSVIDDRLEDLDKLDVITCCVIFMRNGHRIVGVNAGPVSTSNFDGDIGKKLARQNAIDQIWPLMGYALREKLFNAG